MPKVTKELMKSLIDAGCFPPRHQQGCPMNYLRTMPMCLAAKGWTVEQIRGYITNQKLNFTCICRG